MLSPPVLGQCADEQDSVCTRSVTLSLPSLENMTVKLKHGGGVSVNGMDIQTPLNHGTGTHTHTHAHKHTAHTQTHTRTRTCMDTHTPTLAHAHTHFRADTYTHRAHTGTCTQTHTLTQHCVFVKVTCASRDRSSPQCASGLERISIWTGTDGAVCC